MGTDLKSIKNDKVKTFLDGLQKSMDDAAWGHEEAKRQIIQMMGQQIRNPKSKGNMLGIWGPPGNGKTSLIKEGIAKAMDKPFIFISLGGATDASFLEGHSFTYEGSIYGRIMNGLITSKCMDPIIYFDELDKISKTPKGDEITNILVHLTDPVQNSHFRDKYFHGIDIDLSRATMIFSYNDPSNVNPVLLDRITTVETKYLLTSQKIHIAKHYLLPTMFKEIGFQENAVTFNDDLLRDIINKYTHEGGVRKLKSLLYNIIRELNLSNLINSKIEDKLVTFPFVVKTEHLKLLLKHKMEVDPDKVHDKPKCGIVNGLYAGSMGIGGVLPIEVVWIPAQNPLQLKATGHLEKVIKESTEVACSLAWNYLGDAEKDKFQEFWKTKPMGFHIHCPEGAVPKDGPSAGAALTLALYSLLTNRKIRNNVAMTGEINLQGQVMAIGGLEEKLEGAKRAGVTLALVPKENKKHLDKIYERNLSLFDSTFKVEIIECFEDVIKHALLPALPTDTPMIKGLFKENDDMKELDLGAKMTLIVNSPNTAANTLANTFVPPTPSKNKKPMK
jgi:endopeptidase La